MINKYNISKSLRDNAQTIADNNNYTLVTDGESKEPDPNETYLEEFTLFGPDNSIGLGDDSSDQQTGIYQINVNTPKHSTKWVGLNIVGVLQEGFPKGLELTNNQLVRIKNSQVSSMMQNDTHLIHVLSITYNVIG